MATIISLPLVESDADLQRRVRIYLASQHRTAIRKVEVHAQSGVVTLRGMVQCFYEKQLSIHLAARVAGVRRLIDELAVHDTSPAL